jgi:hypothetical protein
VLVDFPRKSGPSTGCVCGIYLAASTDSASLSPSYALNWHEEAQAKMMKFVRQILVVAIMAFVSVGAFAQRKGQDKRPPKQPAKVIDKKDTRPPSNSNRPKPRDDKKKPFFG